MTILELLFGSPDTKSHSDVNAVRRCRKYYMGEGSGFLRIQAVVSFVSPKLLCLVLALKVFQKMN
jgi:hypothetical protein